MEEIMDETKNLQPKATDSLQTDIEEDLDKVVEQCLESYKSKYEESQQEKPFSEIEQEMRSKIKNTFCESGERFLKGYIILLDEIKQIKSNLVPYLIEKKRIEDRSNFQNQINEGVVPCEILGLSEDALSTFYTTALYLLEHNRYEEASHAFFCLGFLDPQIPVFWQGLARSEARLDHQEAALQAYKAALTVEEDNTELYSEAIRYCVEIKKGKEIKEFLNLAIQYANEHPEEPVSEILRKSASELENELAWIINS